MKGISQVISAVMILAVAVSVSAIYIEWAPDLAERATGEVADQSSDQIKCDNAGIFLSEAEYVQTANRLDVWIENTGTIAFEDDVTVSSLKDSSVQQQTTISLLEVDEEQLVELRVEEMPDSVAYSSQECPEVGSSTDNIQIS